MFQKGPSVSTLSSEVPFDSNGESRITTYRRNLLHEPNTQNSVLWTISSKGNIYPSLLKGVGLGKNTSFSYWTLHLQTMFLNLLIDITTDVYSDNIRTAKKNKNQLNTFFYRQKKKTVHTELYAQSPPPMRCVLLHTSGTRCKVNNLPRFTK